MFKHYLVNLVKQITIKQNNTPMNKTLIKFPAIIIIATGIIVFSCVPARKYEELQNRRQQCEDENIELRTETERLHTENNELKSKLESKEQTIEQIENDTIRLHEELESLRKNYEQLHETYQIVLEKNEKLLEGERSETQQLMERLQETQKDLQEREDELQATSRKLEEKEQSLNALNQELEKSLKEVEEKDARLSELESILNQQDSVVNALRERVSNALLGFEDKGLSVEIRKGKVYVSLEESLLFQSGQYEVDPEGVNALKELAKVLERNPDINVMVEGHTDDVPLIPSGDLQGNWDLSVMRATSIVKILLEQGNIEPERLIAAGRGEHMPVDPSDTPEARRKNRRTEIILTPQLDELFQIIETN